MKIVKYSVLIVLAFSLTSCNLFKKKRKPINSPDTLIHQTVPKPKPVKDTVEIVTVVEETEPVKITEPGVGYTGDKYYMIVGSFLSEKLAMKYAKTVLDMGYQPQVIHSPSTGFYRVSASSFTDYQTAINEISNYRSSVTNRAWVHVKR